MRHMLLAYKKLSFSQVYKLYKSLQQYYHSEYAKPTHSQLDVPALLADDSDMDLTSTDETVGDKTDKEEADAPLHPSELQSVTPTLLTCLWRRCLFARCPHPSALRCRRADAPSRGPMSQKQAEYFLARQVILSNQSAKTVSRGSASSSTTQQLGFPLGGAEKLFQIFVLFFCCEEDIQL